MSDTPEDSSEIIYKVQLPNRLLGTFLQHIRDFEARHFEEVHISIAVDCPGLGVDRMEQIMRGLDPPLPHMTTIRKN